MIRISGKFILPLLTFVFMLSTSLFAQSNDVTRYKLLLKDNAASLGITNADIDDAVITDYHTDQSSQITYVYLQQAFQGIRLYNVIKTIAFKDNTLVYHSGKFITDLSGKISGTSPSLSVLDAVKNTSVHLNLLSNPSISIATDQFNLLKKYTIHADQIAKKDIDVELMFLPNSTRTQINLVWNVSLDVINSDDYWNVRVNALNGNVLEKNNFTVHERAKNAAQQKFIPKNYVASRKYVDENKLSAFSYLPPPNVTTANYEVIPYPIESPNFGAAAQATNPWLLCGTTNNATTNGWHFDGTTNYNVTRGNNVYAFLDVANTNTPSTTKNWPDTSSTVAPTLNFIHVPNYLVHPSSTTNGSNNKKFALDNLFYWNNLMHDVSYQYGFDEASGNFQNNNLSRGGSQLDYVEANAQDGGGTDNANFSAPADGSKGRMQMYLWNINTPATVTVNTPSTIPNSYTAIEGAMSTNNLLVNVGPVTAPVVYFNDDAAGTAHQACGTAANAAALNGKIVLIDRGNCNFTVKVTTAQNAHAKGVIMINTDDVPITMSGASNAITIPAVLVSNTDGQTLKSALSNNLNVTLNAPVLLDGDIDNGVVSHEYTHGISIRLTGGASNSGCLDNAEEGGEGWSDYMALMMTTNWTTAHLNDGNLARPIGTYVLHEVPTSWGIRRYPYSVDMTIDPLTYDTMAISTEIHDIGEIWCSVLWDMTWMIIQQQGVISHNIFDATSVGGNIVALKLVLQGLKLQPCSPGYIDARNAILAADASLYNNAHRCAIWTAFARRGMGYSASQGLSSDATDQTSAFDLPPDIANSCFVPLRFLGFNAAPVNEEVVLNWKTANEANTNNFAIEFSTDATSWISLGTVTAKNKSLNDYQFIHYTPVEGNNYYRLKMLDNDGKFTYSEIRKVNFTKGKAASLVLIPNPAIDQTTLFVPKPLDNSTVNIYDATGSKIKSIELKAGIQKLDINTANWANGIYIIETFINNQKQSTRLVVHH